MSALVVELLPFGHREIGDVLQTQVSHDRAVGPGFVDIGVVAWVLGAL
ncbi:Uncharacterised protein [Mycobacteroides abscessus subsp. abscessus]|nr:Uncharacterised protein [Mycobacteroides abscessus subsp. abscessus]